MKRCSDLQILCRKEKQVDNPVLVSKPPRRLLQSVGNGEQNGEVGRELVRRIQGDSLATVRVAAG